MLLVEPRALIEKLNSACSAALQAGAAASVATRRYEVTVEHLLMALLDDPESDVAYLLAHFGTDVSAVRGALQRTLGELRGGNAGKPVFSPILLEWLQDAWLFASMEAGATRTRSGALLVRLALAPTRYLASTVPDLGDLPVDDLRRNFVSLAAASREGRDDARVANVDAGKGSSPSGAPGGGAPSALGRFATNLTERARAGSLDPVFGREPEIRQVVDILCRRRKNNPIIVGEPGVGKTALVEGLALRIAHGDVPDLLRDTDVLTLDLGALQAGASMKGEFESRLKSVLDEVKASPRPLVLFIDEAHTLIGAGGPQGGGDAANLLKPALARGELRTIAATTWAEYKKYFEKDAALERRFQPVKVNEPTPEGAMLMLRGLARRLEQAHGVLIPDDAVRAAVTLSSRYISGRQLPDKAVDLLDTSAARVRVMRGAPPAALEDARADLAGLERELAAFTQDRAAGLPVHEPRRLAAEARRTELLVRIEELEARTRDQRAVIARIDDLRKRLAEGHEQARPQLEGELERLRAIPREELLVHADVDEALVGAIVSDWTGIPVGRMVKDDLAAILSLETRLRLRVRGQDAALDVIGRELRAARAGLKPVAAPLGVFLLAGPSGVGKTETALGLADALFGGERFMCTINMSEFQERHTTSRLIGSPPGYVGYGEGGMLTEAVRQRPYSVVLLDEVEKADKDVMNLFYQVFDKGMLTDGEGRLIDFSNTVIVMTSNLGTELLTRAAAPPHAPPPLEELVALVKPTLSAHFKPALLARMTVVPYVPIGVDALAEIARMKVDALAARALEAHGVSCVVDDGVVAAIAARCGEVDSGARNVDHILRGSLMPALSSLILGAIADGAPARRVTIRVGERGDFVCTVDA